MAGLTRLLVILFRTGGIGRNACFASIQVGQIEAAGAYAALTGMRVKLSI